MGPESTHHVLTMCHWPACPFLRHSPCFLCVYPLSQRGCSQLSSRSPWVTASSRGFRYHPLGWIPNLYPQHEPFSQPLDPKQHTHLLVSPPDQLTGHQTLHCHFPFCPLVISCSSFLIQLRGNFWRHVLSGLFLSVLGAPLLGSQSVWRVPVSPHYRDNFQRMNPYLDGSYLMVETGPYLWIPNS